MDKHELQFHVEGLVDKMWELLNDSKQTQLFYELYGVLKAIEAHLAKDYQSESLHKND